MKIYFTINDVEYGVDFDFKITSRGCPAHMGSLTYPGHSAEPMEWEIEGDLKLTSVAEPDKPLTIPDWLDKQLREQLEEDDSGTIQDHIVQNGDDYDRY